MATNLRSRLMMRFFILFIVVIVLAMVFAAWLDNHKINHLVVISANALLLVFTGSNMLLQVKAMANPNPNVFVRSVMGGTFAKMFLLLIIMAVYLFAAGANRSIYAVLVSAGLYVAYTAIEVKGLLELNKKTNGKN